MKSPAIDRAFLFGYTVSMNSIINQPGGSMTPVDFVPTYAVYVSDSAAKPVMRGFRTLDAAKDAGAGMLRRFVVRRSRWTVMGELPNGMVVHTVR